MAQMYPVLQPSLAEQDSPSLTRRHEPQDPVGQSKNNSGLKPVGRAVLLQTLSNSLKTDKIVLPDSVKARIPSLDTEAIVLALGAGCYPDEPPRCKVGDHVIIAAMSGALRMGRDGIIYRLINDRDIYCLIEEEDA